MQSQDTSHKKNFLIKFDFTSNIHKFIKKSHLIIFLISVILILNLACQNPVDQATYKVSFLKGTVTDFNLLTGLDSVNIIMDLHSLQTFSDDTGHYYFSKIQMPRDQYTVYLTISKSGYQSKYLGVNLYSGDTSVLDFNLRPN
jgi:hypothetical protein